MFSPKKSGQDLGTNNEKTRRIGESSDPNRPIPALNRFLAESRVGSL